MTLEEFASEAAKKLKPLEENHNILWWVLGKEGLVARKGTWCEFGVQAGATLRPIAKQRGDAELWGFDSFRGLPEDWNPRHRKGMFKLDQPPMPPEGVNLIVGWFQDTLPCFTPKSEVTLAFVDCDLYSAGKTVLEWLLVPGRMADGCIIVFDDIFTPPHDNGLMRAFYEVHEKLKFEWVARNQGGDMAAIKVVR